jgi:hypothetical protein
MATAGTAALATCVLFFAPAVFAQPASDSLGELLVGKAAFSDWRTDAPLVWRKITDLPPPYATRSASNPPRVIVKPASATPKVPPGFEVELFVSNLHDPRMVRVAPNGDILRLDYPVDLSCLRVLHDDPVGMVEADGTGGFEIDCVPDSPCSVVPSAAKRNTSAALLSRNSAKRRSKSL